MVSSENGSRQRRGSGRGGPAGSHPPVPKAYRPRHDGASRRRPRRFPARGPTHRPAVGSGRHFHSMQGSISRYNRPAQAAPARTYSHCSSVSNGPTSYHALSRSSGRVETWTQKPHASRIRARNLTAPCRHRWRNPLGSPLRRRAIHTQEPLVMSRRTSSTSRPMSDRPLSENPPPYVRPSWFTRRIVNPLLMRFGGAPGLAVRGRTSGQWGTVPVNVLELEGPALFGGTTGRDPVGAQPAGDRPG